MTKKSISNNSKKKRNLLRQKNNMADTPTDESSKVRKHRSRNFSEAEKAAIHENVSLYKSLLGKKHVSGTKNKNTKKSQDEAWKVTDSVNAIGRALRTVDEVKGKAHYLLSQKNIQSTLNHIFTLILFVHTSFYLLN